MTLRFFIYRSIPLDENFDQWIFRDTIMDLPRAFVGVSAIWFAIRKFGAQEIGLNKRGFLITSFFLILSLLILVFDGWARTPYRLSNQVLILLSFNSLLVAFHEEVLFRGLGISALSLWRGKVFALFTSSALFTIYHFQAQPILEWPAIFFVGLLWGQLRILGISLFWIVLSHCIYDSLWFLLEGTGGSDHRWITYAIMSAFLPLILYGGQKFGWVRNCEEG